MRELFKKAKMKIAGAMLAASAAVATVVSSSAAEPSSTDLSQYSDQIQGQFQNAADGIVPILIGILGVGLGIFVIFKGIKLAKKMFGTVSNG
jgi:hypothetical protein